MKTAPVNFARLVIPAIILRLLFSALFFHPDIKSQHFHAQFLSHRVINIYEFINNAKNALPYTDTFNYPPLTYYFLGSWNFIAGKILGPDFYTWLNDWGPAGHIHSRMFEFMLVLKFPYLLLDLLIIVLLLKLGQGPAVSDRKLLALWLFNPLSLYAVYMLGQFDILPAALTVAALLLVQNQRLASAACLLGLGAALKTYPLLLLPFVLIRCRGIKQISLSLLGFLLMFITPMLPVINSPSFRYAMTHSNLMQGIFYANVAVSTTQNIPLYVVVWGLAFWFSWKRRKNFDILPELFTITFTVTLLSHFHAQWLVWSLPFLLFVLAQNTRIWPVVAAVALGYFGTTWLIPDQYVLLGLFSPINAQALIFPSVYELINSLIQPELLQSIFHTLLAASGAWLIFTVWKSYDHK